MMNRMNDELMNQVTGGVDSWNQAPQCVPEYMWYQAPQSNSNQNYPSNSWNQAPQGNLYPQYNPYQNNAGNSWNQSPYYYYGTPSGQLPSLDSYCR